MLQITICWFYMTCIEIFWKNTAFLILLGNSPLLKTGETTILFFIPKFSMTLANIGFCWKTVLISPWCIYRKISRLIVLYTKTVVRNYEKRHCLSESWWQKVIVLTRIFASAFPTWKYGNLISSENLNCIVFLQCTSGVKV